MARSQHYYHSNLHSKFPYATLQSYKLSKSKTVIINVQVKGYDQTGTTYHTRHVHRMNLQAFCKTLVQMGSL